MAPVVAQRFARLSHVEWEQTVVDLLELPGATGLSESLASDALGGKIFDNRQASLTVSPPLWNGYRKAAEALAERVTSDAGLLARLLSETTQSDPPEARARAFILAFGLKAYRRPLTAEELEAYAALFARAAALSPELDPFLAGVRLSIATFLQSPHFIYREDLAPTPTPDRPAPLDGRALASRLSYALWSSMPDAELRRAAAAGELESTAGLEVQVERLLASPRATPAITHQDLFGVSRLDPAQQAQLDLRRRSVNDLVRGELKQLLARTDLSLSDRTRLDQHLTAIRDLESQLAGTLSDVELQALAQGSSQLDNDDTLDTVIRLHCDVMVLAVASGLRRAATLQLGPGADMNRYHVDGDGGSTFHEISHRIGPNNSMDLHHQIDRKLLGYYKYLLDKLAAYQTPTGTLLDSGLTVYVSDVANKFHEYENIPYLLAGSASGFIKTGQYLDLGGVNNNKILNTIGAAVGLTNAAGQPLDDFGDENLERGSISALLAT